MHIKTIKGKKYYYESKRIGKKVTSVYIGPVEKVEAVENELKEEIEEVSESSDSSEEDYVG